MYGEAGGCLVRKRETSQNGRLNEFEVIELSIACLRLDERNLASASFFAVPGLSHHPNLPMGWVYYTRLGPSSPGYTSGAGRIQSTGSLQSSWA